MAAIAGAERTQDALRSNFIAIDAWNEWGEGNVLEPNSENGFGMHEACRDYDDDRAVPDTDLISKCVVPKDARFEDNLDLDLWRVRGALAHAQLNEWRRRPLPAAVAAADASDESVERGAGMVFVIGMHKTGTMSLGLALEKLDFNVYQLQSAGAMLEKRCFQDRLYPNATDAVMFNQESRGRLLFCLKQNGVFQNATAFQDTRPSQRPFIIQKVVVTPVLLSVFRSVLLSIMMGDIHLRANTQPPRFYGLATNLIYFSPRAKFVYMMRPVDEWWSSAHSHFTDQRAIKGAGRQQVFLSNHTFDRGNILDAYHGVMYGASHSRPETYEDRAVWTSAYVMQAREIMTRFAFTHENSLLVIDLEDGDGFNILAPFLGMPHAASWDFPRVNSHFSHTTLSRLNNDLHWKRDNRTTAGGRRIDLRTIGALRFLSRGSHLFDPKKVSFFPQEEQSFLELTQPPSRRDTLAVEQAAILLK